MKSLIILSLLKITISVSSSVHPFLNSRIFGGGNAEPGQFPFQVGIVRYSVDIHVDTFCGGSLISNEWVLSTAFCALGVTKLKVFLGDIRFKKGISYEIQPNYITIHKDFNSKTKENDISVINIPYTYYTPLIQKIKLPRRDDRKEYNAVVASATGWGWTEQRSHALILQYASFVVMSNENCKSFMPNIHETQLCVVTTKWQSPCYGDLGGPLIHQSLYGLIQIGITSYGTTVTCDQGTSFGFTRISKYLNWINRKTGIPI